MSSIYIFFGAQLCFQSCGVKVFGLSITFVSLVLLPFQGFVFSPVFSAVFQSSCCHTASLFHTKVSITTGSRFPFVSITCFNSYNVLCLVQACHVHTPTAIEVVHTEPHNVTFPMRIPWYVPFKSHLLVQWASPHSIIFDMPYIAHKHHLRAMHFTRFPDWHRLMLQLHTPWLQ